MKKVTAGLVVLFVCIHGLAAEVPSWVSDEKAYDELIQIYVSSLNSLGVKKLKVNKAEGYVEITEDTPPFTKGLQLGLTNVYTLYLKNKSKDEVSSFVTRTKSMLDAQNSLAKDLENFDTAKKYLTLRIFPEDYAPFDKSTYIFKKDFYKLASAITVDTEFGVRPLNKSETTKWNKSDDEIFQFALDSTKHLFTEDLQSTKLNQTYPIYFYADTDNFFVTTLVYYQDLYKQIDNGNGVVIGLPARHYFLAMPVDKDTFNQALLSFYNLVSRIHDGEPGPTSTDMIYIGHGLILPISAIVRGDKVNFVMAEEIVKGFK